MKTIFIILLLVCLLGSLNSAARGFDAQVKAIVKPHLFSIAGWELKTVGEEIEQLFTNGKGEIKDEVSLVTDYFHTAERIKSLKPASEAASAGYGDKNLATLQAGLDDLQEHKAALESAVERIMEKQIRESLTEEGIFNPFASYEFNFPPVNFEFGKLPYLLVISPRERIESIREITLESSLTLEEMESIETTVDELNVSSLVVGISGLGATYPTLVTDEASLQSTLDIAVEEWLHQYLVFKPLGFMYFLDVTGISRNYDIATMNETLAGMVSEEIGSLVYEKYYFDYEDDVTQNQTPESDFDFNSEMREIRKRVDIYLAKGEIERAEEFMEEKCQYLASQGYYIRKLNQAYFAFHGTYADKPAFVNPIGLELKELRNRSASLKDFLDTVASMKSRQDLRNSLTLGEAVEAPIE